jgi:hypothetical protein
MKIRISSFMTFLLKYIGSLLVIGITLLPIIATIFVFQDITMIPVCLISSLILYMYVPRLIKLKSIYVDDKHVYVSNMFKTIKFERELVDFIQRDFLYFYIVVLKSDCEFGKCINFTAIVDYQTNVLFLLRKGNKFSLEELIDKVNKSLRLF